MSVDEEKRAVAERAAELVESGMRVGLGTGTTVAFLLEALGHLKPDARFVATSPQTEAVARNWVYGSSPLARSTRSTSPSTVRTKSHPTGGW